MKMYGILGSTIIASHIARYITYQNLQPSVLTNVDQSNREKRVRKNYQTFSKRGLTTDHDAESSTLYENV